ncbi:DUF2065 domain-containing protein [Kiloniella majae]|jgi:uncharacterized protein|uniref:DUF2065 domain-containing protein n=1 Tax=Kiloniella majae TaxID=1938558 RepID=UPI000A277E9F|nr:DUF2065 domain-containing protein [Kiloniella majae]
MTEFLTALAMVLVIEGIFLSLFPHRLRQLLELLNEMSPSALRAGGLSCAVVGVFLIWIIRSV